METALHGNAFSLRFKNLSTQLTVFYHVNRLIAPLLTVSSINTLTANRTNAIAGLIRRMRKTNVDRDEPSVVLTGKIRL